MARENGVVWYLTIEKAVTDSVVVLAMAGRVSAATCTTLAEALTEAGAGPHRAVVVDLSGIDYISSAGLRALEAGAGALRSRQRPLVVCGVGDVIRPVFDLAGSDERLAIEPTRELAIARARGG